jgi:hypothetical protein
VDRMRFSQANFAKNNPELWWSSLRN